MHELPEDPTQAAVSLFWTKRADQMAALADGGRAGGAARAGGHMNAVRSLVASMFVDAGLPDESLIAEPFLPGYFRARKRWDLAVKHKGTLVASVEFKSQVGSVGKNFNNRFEEALGSALDLWSAQSKNQAFGETPPWLGYVFILREDQESERPNLPIAALFPADETFRGMSYSERYQEMIKRFMNERVYQASWFLTTRQEPDGTVTYREPLAIASGKAFRTAIEGRVRFIQSVVD